MKVDGRNCSEEETPGELPARTGTFKKINSTDSERSATEAKRTDSSEFLHQEGRGPGLQAVPRRRTRVKSLSGGRRVALLQVGLLPSQTKGNNS